MESSGSRDKANRQNSDGHDIPTEIHKNTEPIKIPNSSMALPDNPAKGGITPNTKTTAAAAKNFNIS